MTDVRTGTASASPTQRRSAHHGSFIWYELVTPDPGGAKRFYGAVVGWNVETGKDGYGHLKAGDSFVGGVLRLTDEMELGGARPTWLGYITVDDVDSAVAAIEQDGGQALMPPFDIPDVGRIALVADPQGAPFYVMTPNPPEGHEDKSSEAFSPDKAGRCAWNELSTTDPDAAIDFYARHFGWRQEGGLDMGEMGEYRFLWRESVGIGAVMPKMRETPASAWSYYFRVEDIDAALAAILSGGGRVLQEPVEIPGGEFALNALDPQGAAFGLVGPRKG